MKIRDVRPCDACGEGHGAPFYVVRISLAFANAQAIRELQGVGAILGGLEAPGVLPVAEALAPDAHVVKVAGDEEPSLWQELQLCTECAVLALGRPMTREADRREKNREPGPAWSAK